MARVLEKVDFDMLKKIFKEERVKAGLDTETNLPPAEKIGTSGLYNTVGLTQDAVVMGIYFQEFNNIQIDPRIMQRIGEDPNSSASFESIAFKVLCHEAAHAVSTNPHENTPLRTIVNSIKGLPVTPGGVAYREGLLGFRLFSQFNEAVTDTIAEEVYAEYLKRSGDTTFFQNKDGSNTFGRSYTAERELLQAFIGAISRSTDVPQEIVWEGVKHAFYTNEKLDSNELAQLYAEIIGINIAEIIKRPKETKDGYTGEIQKLDGVAPHADAAEDLEENTEFMEELITAVKTYSPTEEQKEQIKSTLK